MLVGLHASETSSVGPIANSVWVLGVFLVWGAVLGRSLQRLIDFEQTSDAAVARIDRRRFLVRLGGTTAAITVAGAVVGELAEERRREAVVRAGGEPVLCAIVINSSTVCACCRRIPRMSREHARRRVGRFAVATVQRKQSHG